MCVEFLVCQQTVVVVDVLSQDTKSSSGWQERKMKSISESRDHSEVPIVDGSILDLPAIY